MGSTTPLYENCRTLFVTSSPRYISLRMTPLLNTFTISSDDISIQFCVHIIWYIRHRHPVLWFDHIARTVSIDFLESVDSEIVCYFTGITVNRYQDSRAVVFLVLGFR